MEWAHPKRQLKQRLGRDTGRVTGSKEENLCQVQGVDLFQLVLRPADELVDTILARGRDDGDRQTLGAKGVLIGPLDVAAKGPNFALDRFALNRAAIELERHAGSQGAVAQINPA